MCAEIAVCSCGLAVFLRQGGIFFLLCGGRAEGETKSRSRGRRRCRRRWVCSELWDQQISRPLSEILKQLNNKVPDSLVRTRSENGFTSKYIPWHIVNRIMNLHAPEWSGEVRSVTNSADAKSVYVLVVYLVTLYGTEAEIFRESIGTASVDDKSYGDPVQKAEAMAFCQACARFGLGLHLYHEDLS